MSSTKTKSDVAELLELLGLSQLELARLLEVPPSTVYRWMTTTPARGVNARVIGALLEASRARNTAQRGSLCELIRREHVGGLIALGCDRMVPRRKGA